MGLCIIRLSLKLEYIFAHESKHLPNCTYFSPSDRKSKTLNQTLRNVRQNTEEIQSFYQGKGIDTVLQLNPGNHYDHTAERTAAGIAWMLSR